MSGGGFPVTGTFWALAAPGATLGDITCDGSLNGLDIDPFILALTATPPDDARYYARYYAF
jgi:hypothetical protein